MQSKVENEPLAIIKRDTLDPLICGDQNLDCCA